MPRRLPGDGALFYSPAKQRWIARIVVDGRRVTRQRTSKAEARRVLERMRRGEVHQRTTRERTGAYLDRWLTEQVALGRYKPNTVHTYRSLLPVVAQGIGHFPLDALTPRQVQGFISAAAREYKPASVQLMRALLGAALKDAEYLGLIDANPVRKTLGPRIEASIKLAPSAAEVRAMLARFTSPYVGMVALAAHYGLRQSEVAGLRWQDIKEGEITVAGQLDRSGEWVPYRKRGSTLTLPMLEAVARTLRAQRAYQAEQRLRAGLAWQDGGFVFTNDDGRPVRQWQISVTFSKAAKGSGLPFKSFHDLRHAANSLLDELGVDQATRMQVLGHAALKTNIGYSHTNAARLRDGLEKLERALGEG
jgi:integrase